MGKAVSRETTRQTDFRKGLTTRFARLMWETYHARVYLFGSQARGTAHSESDYDLVAVSEAFAGQSPFRRCLDRYDLWHAAGGFRQSLDLHCYTPPEFRAELAGLGYLAHARASGELVRVRLPRSVTKRPDGN